MSNNGIKFDGVPTNVDVKGMQNLARSAQRANGNAEVSARKARIQSAVATAVAVRDGFLGGASPLYPTQGEYATAIGASPAGVTQLKRLGAALLVGLDPVADPETWNALSGTAGTKFVGNVLDSDSLTLDMVVQCGKDVQEGKHKASRPAQPEGHTDGESGETVKPSGLTGMALVAEIVTALSDAVKDLGADDWIATADRLNDIITRENTLRSKQAATPKRAPRKPKAA